MSKLTLAELLAQKAAPKAAPAVPEAEKVSTDARKGMTQALASIIPIKKPSLAEILAKSKEAQASLPSVNVKAPAQEVETKVEESNSERKDFSAVSLDNLNDRQKLAIELAFAGKTFALTGPAGSGKTTTLKELARALLRQGNLGVHSFKIQGTDSRVESCSIAFVAYTRTAVGNMSRAIMSDDELATQLAVNVTTIHNLLEYAPTVYIGDNGEELFRFEPRRTASNPLNITHLVIEESTLASIDLATLLYDALKPGVQIIIVGDIQQLQPVFGPSIMNYALVQVPVVGLNKVYRQSGDSPVLANAHHIIAGESLEYSDKFRLVEMGEFQESATRWASKIGASIPQWIESGVFNPETDIFLSPWNVKDLGTENLNRWIAQKLGDMRKAVVHEVRVGFREKHYYAEGDKVYYKKQPAVITKIEPNPDYTGIPTAVASEYLTRYGTYSHAISLPEGADLPNMPEIDIDAILAEGEDESAKRRARQSSHLVTIRVEDSYNLKLGGVGDLGIANFYLGYAITVHKAQGGEWRKVFIVMHKDHHRSLSREMLYTAVTRAREEIVIFAKSFTIDHCIKTQVVPGNTVEDKIAYFNSGLDMTQPFNVTK